MCALRTDYVVDGDMFHYKRSLSSLENASRRNTLCETKYPRIINFVECSVTTDIDHRLVIRDDADVNAALGEVA